MISIGSNMKKRYFFPDDEKACLQSIVFLNDVCYDMNNWNNILGKGLIL